MSEDSISREDVKETMRALKEKTAAALTDESKMPIGKYKGMLMKDVPLEYIEWMVNEKIKYPRVRRGNGWKMVIEWVKLKV